MKRFEIVVDVTFYTDVDSRKLYGTFIAGVDANSLLSALKLFESEIHKTAVLFDAIDYFVVPLYIGKDQNVLSKKYYREVVLNDDELWKHWCC